MVLCVVVHFGDRTQSWHCNYKLSDLDSNNLLSELWTVPLHPQTNTCLTLQRILVFKCTGLCTETVHKLHTNHNDLFFYITAIGPMPEPYKILNTRM